MKFSPGTYVLLLALVCSASKAAKKKKLSDAINTCKRNHPDDLSKCFLANLNKLLPILKNGATEMNVVPIDPFQVESVKVDFTATQNVKLVATLQNLTIYGWSASSATKGGAWQTSDGIQFYLENHLPAIVWQSTYNAVGSFQLISINTTGDFRGEFTSVKAHFAGNSTRYMKNDEEYLIYTGELFDLTIEKMILHFDNLLGTNTQLNEHINHAINENANMLYEEVKPVIMQVIKEMILQIVNRFHETFPYDLLYPKE